MRPDKTMWLSLIPTSHSKMLREQLLPRARHRLHLSKQTLLQFLHGVAAYSVSVSESFFALAYSVNQWWAN